MELTCWLMAADRERDHMADPDPVPSIDLHARPGVNLDTGVDTVFIDLRLGGVGRLTLEFTPDQFAVVARQFADVASLVVSGKEPVT
jgi:hypothetical protein